MVTLSEDVFRLVNLQRRFLHVTRTGDETVCFQAINERIGNKQYPLWHSGVACGFDRFNVDTRGTRTHAHRQQSYNKPYIGHAAPPTLPVISLRVDAS